MSIASQNRHLLSRVLALMLIVGTGILVYGQVYSFDFVYFDDNTYVFQNRQVLQGLSMDNLWWAFTATVSKHWHPLTWLSHMLDVELFGVNPTGHHLVNLGLHLLTALLLFWFLSRTTADLAPALFVALAFTLHPLHVENVAWVADRKDLLCALFWMAALHAYAGYARQPAISKYVLALFVFILATLSKSMAVTLPLIFFLMDMWPLKRTIVIGAHDSEIKKQSRYAGVVKLFLEKLPFLAISIAIGLITVSSIQTGDYHHTPTSLQELDRLGLGLRAYIVYFGKLFYPADLVTPYPVNVHMHSWMRAFCVGLAIAFTAGAIRSRQRHPYLLVGWLWYLITLLPVAGFTGPPRMANRYVYIPLIGIYILLAWGAAAVCKKWPRLTKPFWVVSTCLLIFWAANAYRLAGTWQNTETLFQHTLKVYPQTSVPHVNLGAYYFARNNLDQAIQHQREAVRLAPHKSEYLYNLGISLSKKKNYTAALYQFSQAVHLSPDYADAISRQGVCLLHLGEQEEARRKFEKVLTLHPDHARTINHLGHYYVLQGDLKEAERHFLRAISIDPEYGDALANLAGTLASMGAYSKSESYYRKALQVTPDVADYFFALASLLAYQNRFKEATQTRQLGLELEPGNAGQHYFMAVDLYFIGDLKNAGDHLDKAKQLGYSEVEKLFEEKLTKSLKSSNSSAIGSQ